MTETHSSPTIRAAGVDSWLVAFADRFDAEANRAALAFGGAVRAARIAGVSEVATTLVSVLVTVRPGAEDRVRAELRDLAGQRDWGAADLPGGRRLWTVPASFHGDHAPDLGEAAQIAGLSPEAAVAEICARPWRTLAVGFAPGQPYLGEMPPHWDVPRRAGLTDRVPRGALITAVRQMIVFAAEGPTGWRRIGQTRFAPFRPDGDPAIPLSAGDEIRFQAVSRAELEALDGPAGGARVEDLP